jgi:hypothetical protein
MFKLKKSIKFIICMIGLSMIFFNCNKESPVSTSSNIENKINRDNSGKPNIFFYCIYLNESVESWVVLQDPDNNIILEDWTNAKGFLAFYNGAGAPEGYYHVWAIGKYYPYPEGIVNFYWSDPETETPIFIYMSPEKK